MSTQTRDTRKGVQQTPLEQVELAGRYQRGLQASELIQTASLRGRALSEARKAVRDGEIAAVGLVESLTGLTNLIADEYARGRLGEEWARAEREEVRSEALVAALQACREFASDRGASLSQWVGREVRNHLTTLEFDSGGGTRPREWRKVAKVGHAVLDSRRVRGLATTDKVLRDEVWNHFFQETCNRIMEGEPGLTLDEVEKKAHDRLSRQSITRAVTRELGEIIATSGGAVSLNVPTDTDDGELIDMVPGAPDKGGDMSASSVVRRLLSTLDDEDAELAISAQGGPVPQASSRSYAAKYGMNALEARSELASMTGRLTAPHAHLCALWDGLEAQLDAIHADGGTDLNSILDAHRERN
jgi:hypothetical protein